ncbi:ATP-dependent RNA helicase RhlB [Acidihalobacter ferrooxydans]|uniref:ATP-dependent RNA helicase RhlB n=1 Tax=Acidihalobacter ferrooxydans TaxID=1765967 RepID=A0A1P8UK79_9GAMM|nr:ATP-dependent RNA helicase RhlB [Acidihalobacter ferrooxydans]APZ44246.1 ATP-dependent RNA helicase RhlB [Acidihalobacter ferrooxydans]
MSDTHLSDVRFDQLELDASVQAGIRDAGFAQATPVQAATLPIALAARDVAGQAQTGTGKTAAFLIVTFDHLLRHPPHADRRPNQPRAIMLAPTRELAIQIHKDAVALNGHTRLTLGLVYGGVDYEKQRQQLADGVDVLIGTPGRIIDYFKQHVFDLRAVQVMVLDEADRMFDLGFIKDIRFLLRRMPPPAKRLSMLFSATLSYRVMELAYEHMNNPQRVQIEPEQVTAERVREQVFFPANTDKIPLLLGILQKEQPERSIVFSNTKRGTELVAGYLEGNGYTVALLSGDVPQKKRQSLLRAFTNGQCNVLVATDVAARGLHIPDVTHVFNFDLPQSAEDYVHRIGRTARAGAKGDAVSFACEDTAFYLPEIEAYIGHKLPVENVSAELLVKPQPPVRQEHAPRQARRSNQGNQPRKPHQNAPAPSSGDENAPQTSRARRRRKPRGTQQPKS